MTFKYNPVELYVKLEYAFLPKEKNIQFQRDFIVKVEK